jgi:SnoaL-like domain
MTNKERLEDIYAMLGKGQLLDAFDKYYAENVTMIEVGESVKEGKPACRAAEVAFLEAIENFNGMGVEAIAASADGNTTMVEVWMDIQFKGAPANTVMKQVAVQKWHEGLIIEEKFYHK